MISDRVLRRALLAERAIPAFNVPYLPMVEPVVEAIKHENTVAFIEVARLEWEKFESLGMKEVRDEFRRAADTDSVFLHLDHIPVIDEDDKRVDYLDLISEALDLGYDSVMVDGSRLPLEENIRATAAVVEKARAKGVPVEAELGAVMGHEESPRMSYEEILRTRTGFTDPEEALRFVEESGCSWLSVAFGNIHGFISKALRTQEKVAATLDVEHLQTIRDRVGIPLVLHGGSGVKTGMLLSAVRCGIAKVNVGTDIRRVYEQTIESSGTEKAQEAVMERTRSLLADHFRISGMREKLLPES